MQYPSKEDLTSAQWWESFFSSNKDEPYIYVWAEMHWHLSAYWVQLLSEGMAFQVDIAGLGTLPLLKGKTLQEQAQVLASLLSKRGQAMTGDLALSQILIPALTSGLLNYHNNHRRTSCKNS